MKNEKNIKAIFAHFACSPPELMHKSVTLEFAKLAETDEIFKSDLKKVLEESFRTNTNTDFSTGLLEALDEVITD